MSTEEMLVAVFKKLAEPAPLPVAIDLWDIAHVAAYLKRSADRVRTDIVCLPSFPAALRIGPGRPQALYKARDVVKWAESQRS